MTGRAKARAGRVAAAVLAGLAGLATLAGCRGSGERDAPAADPAPTAAIAGSPTTSPTASPPRGSGPTPSAGSDGDTAAGSVVGTTAGGSGGGTPGSGGLPAGTGASAGTGAPSATSSPDGGTAASPAAGAAEAGGWLLPAAGRMVVGPGGVTEVHDGPPGRAPLDAPRTPLRPGTLSLSTATGEPDPPTLDATAVDGGLVPLRSPVYLGAPATDGGATLTVLVSGPPACHGRLGLSLWALEDGSWAAALRLPAEPARAAGDDAACQGGQVILRAPAPAGLSAAPPASVLTPPAEALFG